MIAAKATKTSASGDATVAPELGADVELDDAEAELVFELVLEAVVLELVVVAVDFEALAEEVDALDNWDDTEEEREDNTDDADEALLELALPDSPAIVKDRL